MGQDGTPFLQKVSNMATSFSNIFETHHNTAVNIIGVIVAFVAEWFVEKNEIFSCPCTKELAQSYGYSFLFGGAIIFWMIGLLIYSQTWRACHGAYCCFPCGRQTCLLKCKYLFSPCVKTLTFPLAWIFAFLVDGDYLACILSESCDETSAEYKMYKNLSQEWSIWVLCILLVSVVVIRGLFRCFNKVNYLQFTSSEAYRKVENEILFNKIPEVAKTLAPQVVNTFYEMEDSEKDWDAATDENQDLGVYLSPMHKFVMDKIHKKQPEKSTNDEKEVRVVIPDENEKDSKV